MASKEIRLQYYSSDQEAAEHYHNVYTTMMNDLQILTSKDFMFSLIDYAMEKNVRSFQEHFLKNV